jgi:hypothetical protein
MKKIKNIEFYSVSINYFYSLINYNKIKNIEFYSVSSNFFYSLINYKKKILEFILSIYFFYFL